MKNILRIATAAAVLVAVGGMTQGCLVDCVEEETAEGDSRTVCTAVEATRYEHAEDITASMPYAAGDALTIENTNGNINVSSGSTDAVEITIERFTTRPKGEKEEAEAEMDLSNYSITTEGGVVRVRRNGGSDFLGADVTVRLPSTFDNTSAFNVDSNNGNLNLRDVRGTLNIKQGNGTSCDVSVVEWGLADGSIACDANEARITVGSGLVGNMTAQIVGPQFGVIDDSRIGADWERSTESDELSASYSFGGEGAATAATVAVTNESDLIIEG